MAFFHLFGPYLTLQLVVHKIFGLRVAGLLYLVFQRFLSAKFQHHLVVRLLRVDLAKENRQAAYAAPSGFHVLRALLRDAAAPD